MSVFVALVGISCLIFLHELGHFLAARAAGMEVERFSVGLGPTVIARRAFGTEWQIGLIPLGGYVLIAGMGDVDDAQAALHAKPGTPSSQPSYADKPLWQRAGVIAAGPAANFVVAVLLISFGALFFGRSAIVDGRAQVGEITPHGAAEAAGLETGDILVSFDDAPITAWPNFVDTVRAQPEQTLALHIERQGVAHVLALTPERRGGIGIIGAAPKTHIVRPGALSSLKLGWTETARLSGQQAKALLSVVTGRGAGGLAGLPAIVRSISREARDSAARLSESLAYLSVGLGIINLVPFPALDGGRLLFLALEAVRRRPASPKFEGFAHTVGFVLLLGVMVFVSVRDLL